MYYTSAFCLLPSLLFILHVVLIPFFVFNFDNMDYGDPIQITFFAVNGAGSGTQAIFSYLFQKGIRFT